MGSKKTKWQKTQLARDLAEWDRCEQSQNVKTNMSIGATTKVDGIEWETDKGIKGNQC